MGQKSQSQENKFDMLCSLLNELQKNAPCKGMSCVGYQNCEYGVNGCYGEECAIEVVIHSITK